MKDLNYKHMEKEINQAQKGIECGIVLEGSSELPNLQLGDLLEHVSVTYVPVAADWYV